MRSRRTRSRTGLRTERLRFGTWSGDRPTMPTDEPRCSSAIASRLRTRSAMLRSVRGAHGARSEIQRNSTRGSVGSSSMSVGTDCGAVVGSRSSRFARTTSTTSTLPDGSAGPAIDRIPDRARIVDVLAGLSADERVAIVLRFEVTRGPVADVTRGPAASRRRAGFATSGCRSDPRGKPTA